MGMTIFPPVAEMTLTAYAPETGIIGIPVADMTLIGATPSVTWTIDGVAQQIFRCILTGAEDGLDDLDLPMAKFTARVRDGDPSYLSCTIPNGSEYEDEVLLRPNGDIVVKYGARLVSGIEQLVEIVRVNYEDMQIDRSATNDTIILTGHKTTTISESKEWPVSNVSYFGMDSDGKRRIRADMDYFLRCGDICQFDDDEMIVGSITYTVIAKPSLMSMEISEA
jgi:hypothetical protein